MSEHQPTPSEPTGDKGAADDPTSPVEAPASNDTPEEAKAGAAPPPPPPPPPPQPAPQPAPAPPATRSEGDRGRRTLGIILIALGCVFLAQQFIDWDVFWPIILIALGVFVLFRR